MVGVQEILSLRQTVLPKASITDRARSCARILQTPGKVSRTGRDDSMPRDVSSDENSRLSSPISGSNPNSVFPARFGNQEVISPSHPSIAKKGRNAETIDAHIDGYLDVNGHSMSYLSVVISLETVLKEFTDVNAHERMNFASNSALGESLKSVDLGISPANTADKLNSVFAPATRAIGSTDNSDWLASRYCCKEVTVVKERKAKSYSDYI